MSSKGGDNMGFDSINCIRKNFSYLNNYPMLKKLLFIIPMFLSFICMDYLLRRFTWTIGFFSHNDVIPFLFSSMWIIFMMSIILLFPKKTAKIIYTVLIILSTIYTSAQYIYFRIFDKFFWIKDAVVAKEGSDYTDYIIEHFDYRFVSIIIITFTLMAITIFLFPKNCITKKSRIISLIISVTSLICLTLLPNMLGEKVEKSWESWRIPRNVYEDFKDQNKYLEMCGAYSFVFRDIYETFFAKDIDYTTIYNELDVYYDSKEDHKPNEYTGLFKGKNVILVMMESMDNFTISEKYTPALYYMSQNGINFTQHHSAIFGAGGTFNSEFTSLGGFHSPVSGNAAYAFSDSYFPYTLPALLKNEGYMSNSFHFNQGSFYNRALMHQALGFDHHYSFIDMGYREAVSEFDSFAVENDDIYKAMIEEKPFFDFFITYSAHLPYNTSNGICKTNMEKYPELVDDTLSEELNCVYLQAKETDLFFSKLLVKLQQDDLLDDTVIVAFTDHVLYGLSETKTVDELNHQVGDVLNERVPFLIYNHGSEAMKINKVTNTTDILPTILNLMGIQPSKYYLGSDALDVDYSGYVFFPDNSWYDGHIYYNSTYKGKQTEYIRNMNLMINERLDINNKVLESDYFLYLKQKNEK